MMITWSLNPQQADFILKVLQQRPHVEVHELITELLRQANAAMLPKEEA